MHLVLESECVPLEVLSDCQGHEVFYAPDYTFVLDLKQTRQIAYINKQNFVVKN